MPQCHNSCRCVCTFSWKLWLRLCVTRFLGQICNFVIAMAWSISVCVCVCLCVTFLINGRILTKIKNVKTDICHRMVSLQKMISVTLTYLLMVKNVNVNISEMVRASAKWIGVFCRFLHLSSNDVIAKFVLCDRDILFEGQIFKMLISLKWWELSQKLYGSNL